MYRIFTGAAAVTHTHTLMDIFVAVRLLQQSCSTFKEVRGQTLTHSTGLDLWFFGPHSPGMIFFSFNFLHPLTESFSLHSSLTKQDGRHKLQYLGHGRGRQMCGETWKRSGSSLQELVNMTSVCVCCAYESRNRASLLWRCSKQKVERRKGRDGRWEDFRGGRAGEEGGLVRGGEASALLQLAANTVQVVHGSVKGEPHSFSDAGGTSLRQLNFVERLVDPEGSHLGSRKPLPEEREERSVCNWTDETDQCVLLTRSY